MVSITLKLQNFSGISVSYVVWSVEISLTEIQLDLYFLQEFSPKFRWRTVADPEFSKRGALPRIFFILRIFCKMTSKKGLLFLKRNGPPAPTPGSSPEVLLNYFI
jgi:hypothetical protein